MGYQHTQLRSSWGLKASVVMLHLLYVGVLFIFDRDLIQKTVNEPWYVKLKLFPLRDYPVSSSEIL